MGTEPQTEVPRGACDRFDLVVLHRCDTSAWPRKEIVAGNIELDDIDAFAETGAHGEPCLLGAIDDHRRRGA